MPPRWFVENRNFPFAVRVDKNVPWHQEGVVRSRQVTALVVVILRTRAFSKVLNGSRNSRGAVLTMTSRDMKDFQSYGKIPSVS